MNNWKKWVGRILLGILLLLFLLILLIHTRPVKNLIRNKLESYLIKKTNSEIHISAINYRLPKWIELDGVFFKDKAGDTLLYGNKLRVDVNMLKLLKGKYEISRIELGDIKINISRNANDSNFNYQYLVDAFKSTTPADTTKKSPISLSLDELEISGTTFKWMDHYGGTLLDTKIGNLKVNIDELDIYKQKYDINKATLADIRFDLHLLVSKNKKNEAIPVSDSAKESILPQIMINDLTIDRSHFAFDGQASGLHTVNEINAFKLQRLAIAAPQKISLDYAELNNSNLLLDRNIIEKAFNKIKQVDTVTSSLAAVVKQVRFYNDTIAYNNPSTKRLAKGFDANHVKATAFTAGFSDLGYGDNTIKAKIDSMSLKEQSGFVMDSMHGVFVFKDMITASNVLLKTPQSRISGNGIFYPFSLDANYKGNEQNHVVFVNNIIARQDLQLFVPYIMDKYSRQLQGVSYVYVTADITGNTRRAVIKTISLHSNKNDININASGTVSNWLSKNALMYDLSIAKLTASKSFLEPFINTKGKQTVNLPPLINVKGKLKGDMRQLTNDLVVTSGYGQASLKGQIRNFTNPDKLAYNMRLIAKDLETGKWVNRDSLLGKLNGTITAKGSGTDYKTATIESMIDLSSFRLQQHVFTGIKFNINGTTGSYDVKGGVADSLLRVNMNVKTSFNQQYPTAVGKVNVQNADLFALGLYKEPFRFRSNIDLQAKDLSPERLNAYVRLDSTIIYQEKRTLRVDSLIARGTIDSGKTLLVLQSPFADAGIKGDFKYTELGDVFTNYLSKYSKNPAASNKPVVASFELNANLKPDPIYALLLPGLFFDKNIHANALIDTKQKDSTLRFYLTAPTIVYNTNRLANLNARITGLNDSLKYSIQADTVRASSLQLYTTTIIGGMSKGNASANFVTLDNNKKEKYALSVTAVIDDDTYKMHLGDKLKMNYADWNVDNKNMIVYNPQGINVSQFNISKGGESISVNSSTAAANAPIDVKIDHFSLQNVTGLLDRDSLEIGGRLNAVVKVEGLDKPVPLFNGTVKIDSLSYQNSPVGNLAVEARNDNNETVTFNGTLTGYGNNVNLKGNYNQDKIDAQVNLNPIEFKTIEPFTQKNLTRSSGTITGNINITGNVKSPEWNGTLRFDSAYTQLAKYGTVLKMNGQQVDLKYPLISFNRFTIKDSLNHDLVINGTLKQEARGFVTDLTVKTRNFTALNNTPVVNNELYGKAIVDVDVIITGLANAPDITGNVGLKDQSYVTFTRQPKVASAKDREGVMEFVDIDTVKNYAFKPFDSTLIKRSRNEISMLNYNLNIDIDKNAKFSIIIDPITRDELQVQGAGQLNAAVNPNGDISLTGAYNLSKGSYQLNYKFLKRRFELQEGSTIVLSGDPANAEANITAIYDIEASPYDLLANEISDNTNSVVYKQKLPFQVVLKIKGRAIEPDMSFDVQLKNNVSGLNYDMSNTIDNKLVQMRGDASTMNKQVFALLVMGRFIGEQSKDFFGTSSDGGLKADRIVKESVSRFLSDAVSQIASDLIKGVELDVNLKTVDNYADATQRTDLNLALSKRFLDDRLSLTVGKNFTIDGEDPLAKGQDNSNVSFLPDITTTYKLSKDGRYMLKAYQKSDYEAILDGYFIETGVAFMLTMDYNRFKEIFRKVRTKEEREQIREQKKAEKERKDKEAEKIKQEEAEKATATKIKTDNEK
ncbi:MAG: translocation/assembly module TamB domain-containing protein [Bacteroidota bacterium]